MKQPPIGWADRIFTGGAHQFGQGNRNHSGSSRPQQAIICCMRWLTPTLKVRPRPDTKCDASRWQNWSFDYCVRKQTWRGRLTEPHRFPPPWCVRISVASVLSNLCWVRPLSALFSALAERSSGRTEARPAQHAQAKLDPNWRIVRARCRL